MSGYPKKPNTGGDTQQDDLNSLLLAQIRPSDTLPQSQHAIGTRLKARAAQSAASHAALLTVRARNGVWQTLKKGVRVKPLWSGAAGNSVLVEFSAGAALPVHRHNWLEEGVVLQGDLRMGDLALGPFDYHVSPAGSRHGRIWSKHGGLAYLRGTSIGDTPATLRELIGGLLPVQGGAATTVYASDEGWQALHPGVFRKQLLTDGVFTSYFYRLEAGAHCGDHVHTQDEECMVLEGEVFIGDSLLCKNDYQLAPKGSSPGPTYSDVGALFYVRSAA